VGIILYIQIEENDGGEPYTIGVNLAPSDLVNVTIAS
jgi:hypothetical protein